MQRLFRNFAALAVLAMSSSIVHAAQQTADDVRAWQKRVVRVQTIARRILVSGVDICPSKRADFGFTAYSPDPGASAAVRAKSVEWLGPGDGSATVVVFPGGPAEASGLRVGDRIVEMNGVRWSATPEGLKAFGAAMAGASSLQLMVKRQAAEMKMEVPAQQICFADIYLTQRAKLEARTSGTNILIDGGLEQLFSDDDELAWIIAHEAAHAMLGHSGPDRVADLKNKAFRSRVEREADALSVRLMLRAGFSPEASSRAQSKLAAAGRGPIGRLLDITGPYMGTRERNAFLMAEAAAARAEQGKPATAP